MLSVVMCASVIFGFDARDKKVHTARTLNHPVFIPFVAINALTNTIFGLAVMLADAEFSTEDFQHISKSCPALASKRM